MKSKILILLFSLLALSSAAPAFAKGDTVKIILTNLQSGMPMELTDYAAVKRIRCVGRSRRHHRRHSTTRRLHYPVVKRYSRSAERRLSALSSEVLRRMQI